MSLSPPRPTLFPYTTLFRSLNGQKQEFAADVNFTENDAKNAFIPRLWATRRVGWLLDEIRLHGESKELKDEVVRSEEHTSELQSHLNLVCRLLLEKKNKTMLRNMSLDLFFYLWLSAHRGRTA